MCCKSVLEAANAVEMLVVGSGVRKADPYHLLIALSISFVNTFNPGLTILENQVGGQRPAHLWSS